MYLFTPSPPHTLHPHTHTPSQIIVDGDSTHKDVSAILFIDNFIWISMVGSGISVYEAASKVLVGVWGVEEREHVYNLLHVKDSAQVFALAKSGRYSFSTELPVGCRAARVCVCVFVYCMSVCACVHACGRACVRACVV